MDKMGILPPDFDPERHTRHLPERRELSEGVNLVQHDPATGFHLIAKVQRGAAGAAIRCWHCYKRPDGSFDCFEIKCPWDSTLTASV